LPDSANAKATGTPGDVHYSPPEIEHAMSGTGRALMAAAVVFAIAQVAWIAWAGEAHRIIQKDRSFQVKDAGQIKDIDIGRGDELQFVNEDNFLHQIYVASGGLNFDSAEQAPGEVIAVKFPRPGLFEIRCHIHPKMSLSVTVK
jgi:plastocyanin